MVIKTGKRGSNSRMEAGALAITLIANRPQCVAFQNPARKSLILMNMSAVNAYVGFSPRVSTSGGLQGIPLVADGGVVEFAEPGIYTGEVWVISPSAITINVSESSEFKEDPD